MKDRRDIVLHASVPRALWTLAWPIVLSNELVVLSGGIMMFWLGRLIGEQGLAVESLFRPMSMLVAWTISSIPVGASVLISRSVGADDKRGMAVVASAVTFLLAVWVLVVALCLPLAPRLASVLAGDGALESSMQLYLIGWLFVALPGMSFAELMLEITNATGDTRFNFVRVLIDLAVIAALTPLLMAHGLGIAGDPVAAGVAGLGLAGLLLVTLIRRRAALKLGELGAGGWRIDRAMWKQLVAIGLPVQVGRLGMFAVQIVLVRMVARDGDATVAGYGLAYTLILVGAMATMGLAKTSGVIIGQAVGAGLLDRARRGAITTLVAGWGVMALFVVGTCFDRPLIGLFTSDAAVVDATHRALSIMRWGLFGGSAWQCLLTCFAAYGTTVRAAGLMLLGEAVGLALAFAWPGANLDAVCVSFIVSNVVKSALLLWLFLRSRTTSP